MNVAGTSAATPTVAGMIGLANDARLTAGKPTLGFLNPWIYQNTEPYFDVTLGSKSAVYNESSHLVISNFMIIKFYDKYKI